MKIELQKIKLTDKATGAWSAQLYADGHHMANVKDANAGDWPAIEYTKDKTKAQDLFDKANGFAAQKGHGHLHNYVRVLYATHQANEAIAPLMETIQKLCKTALVFKLPRHQEGEYELSCEPPTLQVGRGKKGRTAEIGSEEHKQAVRDIYAQVGVEVVEFYNDRFSPVQGALL